jgi:hypothetical protein
MYNSSPSSSSISSEVRKNEKEVERKKKYQDQVKKRKEEETRKQQEAALRLQRQQEEETRKQQEADLRLQRQQEEETRKQREAALRLQRQQEEETRKQQEALQRQYEQQEAALRLQRQQDVDKEVEKRRLEVAHCEPQKQEEEETMPGTDLGVGSALDGDAKQKRLNELDNQRLLEHSTAKAELSDNKKKIKVVDPSIAMAIVSTSENTIATTDDNAMAIIPTGEIAMTDKFESLCVKLNIYYESEFTDSQKSYVFDNCDILTENEADLFGWMSYINDHQVRFPRSSLDCLPLFINCAESNSISYLKSDVNIATCEEWLLKRRSDAISSPGPWLRIEDGAPTLAIENGTPIRGARVQARDQQRKAAEKNIKQDMLVKNFTPASVRREARSANRRGLKSPPVCVGSERGKRPEAVGTQRRSSRRLGSMPSGPMAYDDIVNKAQKEAKGKSFPIEDIESPQIE